MDTAVRMTAQDLLDFLRPFDEVGNGVRPVVIKVIHPVDADRKRRMVHGEHDRAFGVRQRHIKPSCPR